jgi:hypothetical protein
VEPERAGSREEEDADGAGATEKRAGTDPAALGATGQGARGSDGWRRRRRCAVRWEQREAAGAVRSWPTATLKGE